MRIYYLCLLYIYIYIKIQHVALRVLSFPPILTFPNSVSRPGAAQDSHSNSDSNSGWHHSNPPCASTTRTSTPWGKVEMMISSREGDDFQPGRGWFPAGKGVQKKLTKMLGSPDINVAIECSILVRQLKNAARFAGCKGETCLLASETWMSLISFKKSQCQWKIHSLGYLTEMMVIFHGCVGFLATFGYFFQASYQIAEVVFERGIQTPSLILNPPNWFAENLLLNDISEVSLGSLLAAVIQPFLGSLWWSLVPPKKMG